jgi:type I restriction enzyme R subunit
MPQPTPEYIYAEKPTIDQLVRMGWQYIEGSWDNAQITERENFKQVLISDRLKAAIKCINLDDNGKEWLDDTQVNAAVSQLERLGAQRLMEANQAATELLLKGTTVLGQDGKQHTVHFIDSEYPENNILTVKSMLLTGFDAPLEQVLYLDRGMKEYELLQAIARVNRVYDDTKKYGLVVDYYGVDIAAALSVYDNVDIENAWFDIRQELPKLRDKHQRVIALFTQNGCTIDDVESCVDLLRDERLRVEFNDTFKDFLDTLDTILPRPEALSYVKDAKKLGLIKKSVADLYRDEKLNLVSAKEKVRALIDQYIESQGIDPKVPSIDILSLDFKTHVQRHRSIKAQAAEMEFAARHHISIHFDEDPVYYKNLSERLTEILDSLADNWDEKVEALRQYIEQIQAGRPTNETGLDPKTQLPFLNILGEHSQIELPKLAQATVEIVDRIRQEVRRVNWASPIVQEDLRRWIADYLDTNDLVDYDQLEEVADKLVQLARKNRDSLIG